MELGLTEKKALVMGASTGIGKAVGLGLAQEGAKVCLNSRNLQKLCQTTEEIGGHSYVAGDLTIPGEGKQITQEAIKKLGGLDILVTNTGGPQKGNFMEVDTDQWHTDFQALWMSVVESLRICLPEMQRQNYGRILLISSIAAKEPLPALTTSNGLRAGLAGFIKSLATEYASYGITLNLLLPGYTNTDRIKNLNLSLEQVKQMVPAGRLGEPEEIGHLAAFLASTKAGYITGQSIAIDGCATKGHS